MPYADEMKRTQEVMTNAIKNLSRNFTSTASSVISLRNASHKGKKYPKRENSQLHVSLCSKVGVAHGKFDRYKSLAGNQHQMQQRAYAQKRRKMLCTSAAMLLVLSPGNSSVSYKIYDGCAVRPMKTSVAAKQASKILVLVWSPGLLFMAIITNALNRTVEGQMIPLIMMFIIIVTSLIP